jgi:hypothetical protein
LLSGCRAVCVYDTEWITAQDVYLVDAAVGRVAVVDRTGVVIVTVDVQIFAQARIGARTLSRFLAAVLGTLIGVVALTVLRAAAEAFRVACLTVQTVRVRVALQATTRDDVVGAAVVGIAVVVGTGVTIIAVCVSLCAFADRRVTRDIDTGICVAAKLGVHTAEVFITGLKRAGVIIITIRCELGGTASLWIAASHSAGVSFGAVERLVGASDCLRIARVDRTDAVVVTVQSDEVTLTGGSITRVIGAGVVVIADHRIELALSGKLVAITVRTCGATVALDWRVVAANLSLAAVEGALIVIVRALDDLV